MAHSTQSLKNLAESGNPNPAEIAACLDELDPAARVAQIREVGGVRRQRALWIAAAANDATSFRDLVPEGTPSGTPVVFHGKNSLPAFSEFEKICYLPSGENDREAWGFNETKVRSIIGPGYYVLHDVADGPGSRMGPAAFDYRQVPPSGLDGWPEVRPNGRGISRFVYGGMVDFMRRLSRDVFIGSAVRAGREMGSYFLLARELPQQD